MARKSKTLSKLYNQLRNARGALEKVRIRRKIAAYMKKLELPDIPVWCRLEQ